MENPNCCQEMADYEDDPHVSLVIPFEPGMKNKSQLERVLIKHAEQTERDLLQKFESQKVMPIIKKLKALITKIDDSANKSIAIFVNSSSEKVIYFNHSDYLENHPFPRL